MLTNEMKRKAFLKLRMENYRASLRLEGLSAQPVAAKKPMSAVKHAEAEPCLTSMALAGIHNTATSTLPY